MMLVIGVSRKKEKGREGGREGGREREGKEQYMIGMYIMVHVDVDTTIRVPAS